MDDEFTNTLGLATRLRTFPFDPLASGQSADGERALTALSEPQGFIVSPDVPLPGTHRFKRVVRLQNVNVKPALAFVEQSHSYAVALGLDPDSPGKFSVSKAVEFWSRHAIASGVEASAVANVAELARQMDPKLLTDAASWSMADASVSGSLRSFIRQLAAGVVEIPTRTASGVIKNVSAPEQLDPAFYLVEEYRMTAFLTNYGLGRTIGTFSLLPGEEQTIRMRSWRASQRTSSRAVTTEQVATTSIVDSVDQKAIDRFTNELQSASGDKSTRSSDEQWHVEGEVGGSVGFAHANVKAGGAGDYKSGQEDFANQATRAVREHAEEASRNRRNTVENTNSSQQTSQDQTQVSAEDETVTERTLKNINLRRVLNYVFRELNQEYDVVVALTGLRFAYFNGVPGCWREVPPSRLRSLVESVCRVNPDGTLVASGAHDLSLPNSADVAVALLRPVTRLLDYKGRETEVLECVIRNEAGVTTEDADIAGKIRPPLELTERVRGAREAVSVSHRFKQDALTRASAEERLPEVDGLVVGRTTTVMRTDSIVAEALLGFSDALDPFAFRSQDLSTRASKAAIALQEQEARKIDVALAALEKIEDAQKRAEAYARMFAPPAAAKPGTP